MYLHIGKGKSVREEEVIGIFDLDTSTISSITKKFIKINFDSFFINLFHLNLFLYNCKMIYAKNNISHYLAYFLK